MVETRRAVQQRAQGEPCKGPVRHAHACKLFPLMPTVNPCSHTAAQSVGVLELCEARAVFSHRFFMAQTGEGGGHTSQMSASDCHCAAAHFMSATRSLPCHGQPTHCTSAHATRLCGAFREAAILGLRRVQHTHECIQTFRRKGKVSYSFSEVIARRPRAEKENLTWAKHKREFSQIMRFSEGWRVTC